ncbi:MAG: hypothetical protein ABFS12_11310 [Bacteroidota bacterium]
MKQIHNILVIIIKVTSLLSLLLYNIGCVDSLNDPYPGIIINEKSGVDTTTDQIEPPTELHISEFTEGIIFGLWWKDNSYNEDGFEIWRKEEANGNYTKLITLQENATAYNDTISDKNSAYSYKVRAFKSTHFSKFSNEVNSVENLVLGAPSDLNGSLIPSTTNVQLSWKDNATNELGFIIVRKMINEFDFSEEVRVGPNNITWTDTSDELQYGETVSYKVRAYSAVEQSNYSNIFTITL